jgi:hypothetical protein
MTFDSRCGHWTSSRTMALGSTQPLTEISTRNLPRGKRRPARKDDNFTAIYAQIVSEMWEPRRLTFIWASTASYEDGFSFYKIHIYLLLVFLIFLSYLFLLHPTCVLFLLFFLLYFCTPLVFFLSSIFSFIFYSVFFRYVMNPLKHYFNLFIRNNYVKKMEAFKMYELKINTKNWNSQNYICCKWLKYLTCILSLSEAIQIAETFRTSWLSVVRICRWVSTSECEQ